MYEKTPAHSGLSGLRGWRILLSVLLLVIGIQIFAGAHTVQAASNGFRITSENGKKVAYYYKNGKKLKNSFLNLSGKKYYFDENGRQVTGWQKGKTGGYIRYFYNKAGAEGFMATGFLKDSEGNIRYFDLKSGLMTRGWLELEDGWRYFDTKTGIQFRGIRKVDKYYYYFVGSPNYKKNGIRCQSGFRVMGDVTYYFDPDDGHAHVGWLTKDGKKYYFNNKGVMYHDTVMTISGKKYQIASDGVCTLYNTAPAAVQEDGKSYSYTDKGSYVVVYDPIRNRNWNLVTEFKTDLGIANGEATDRDILAALVEAEAGSTGLIGMEAVALTVLNRTIDRYFPSEVRYVVYQECNSSHIPGHSVVRYPVSDPWLNMRLKGTFYNKELAYKAVDEAYRVFNAFVKNGEDRVIPGFNDGKDMNFKYFMTPAAFKAAGLRCESYTWNNMTFFVDWPL